MSTTEPRPTASIPAWFAAPISSLLASSTDEVLGRLLRGSSFAVTPDQGEAWKQEIYILRDALKDIPGWVALEYDIPRLGTRIDVLLITGSALIPIEFKVGAREHTGADTNQAWDYALDLKNFHALSHSVAIFPIHVATEATFSSSEWGPSHADGVFPPLKCTPATLRRAICWARELATGPALDGEQWLAGAYQPTPTIVEAARALYARHTVEAISRNDAGAKNLTSTARAVDRIIVAAGRERFKAIVFVTGVPGAGKTLVGLNTATQHGRDDSTHAVFLSGNDPLVKVLREALTRDELARLTSSGRKARKGDVSQRVKPFIQNIHHFRDDGLRTIDTRDAPHDRVVIFDEAQRAWDLEMTVDFMRRKKSKPSFGRSESQFLIEYMDRHSDWTVVICLVGGGQEINRGEAGISGWLNALREHFPTWRVFISPELSDAEYAAGRALEELRGVASVTTMPELHLSVSMRAFRSEKLSSFVKAVLDLDASSAANLLREVTARYPMGVTRNLDAAKKWMRHHARGTERYGLVASSGAQRLKPHAVDVRVDINPVHWFLNDADDTRSSYYLEDAATEFQIQGLELDWICVSWDADLRYGPSGWQHRTFNARGWQHVRNEERQHYLLNAYRVLLTRARQGMVIFVPPGDPIDPTRKPEFYDGTYQYLREIGIPPIDG